MAQVEQLQGLFLELQGVVVGLDRVLAGQELLGLPQPLDDGGRILGYGLRHARGERVRPQHVDHQHRHHQPRKAHQHEGGAPAHFLVDPATREITDHRSNRNPERIDAERRST